VCFRLLYNALTLTQPLLIARCVPLFSFERSQMRKKKRKTTTMVKKITTMRTAMTTANDGYSE
jgi:hypothetical protein